MQHHIISYLGTKLPIEDLRTVSNVINSLLGTEIIVEFACNEIDTTKVLTIHLLSKSLQIQTTHIDIYLQS